MATTSRVGSWLILAGGLFLVGMMGYALSIGGGNHDVAGGGASIEVAVFYPDTNSWRNFRQGIEACTEAGLARPVEQGTDTIVIRENQSGRTIRFSWDGSLGIRESRESLRRRLASPTPPSAIIGSSNTALTAALAECLAEHAGSGPSSPVLLIPAATAVVVESDPSRVAEKLPLLQIHPGRTFRLCLNNARFAELVVGYLADRRRERPVEVVLVADSFDPFSEDLAAEFRASVERRFPETPLTRSDPKPGAGGLAGSPSPDELDLAQLIWSKAVAARSAGGSVWVLLTTQGSPAQRLLEVLRASAPPAAGRPDNLRVLCGDGIGRPTLASFVGLLPFPVYSAASTSVGLPSPPSLRSGTGQIEAEAISALIVSLAVADGPRPDLAPALARLAIGPKEPGSLGRSIVFERGERGGIDLGHVLEARPDEPRLLAHQPDASGRWIALRWSAEGWRLAPESAER